VNSVATHVLTSSEFKEFEKLSPVGKWLFLPKLMKLKWSPGLDQGCLQQFAELAGRRNHVVHPRISKVAGVAAIGEFLKKLKLDEHVAKKGRQAVIDLIRGLSLSWRGSYGPDWLRPESAKARPPCLFLGSVEASARLAKPGDHVDKSPRSSHETSAI